MEAADPTGTRDDQRWRTWVVITVAVACCLFCAAYQLGSIAGRRAATETLELVLLEALNDGDWEAALRLARSAERRDLRANAGLTRLIAGAYWRAGCIEEAERVAAHIPTDTIDRYALWLLSRIHLGRGELIRAGEFADRLRSLGYEQPGECTAIADAWFALDRLDGVREMLRKAASLATAPDSTISDTVRADLKASADFFDFVGSEPLNQIVEYGCAPLRASEKSRVPICDVWINGQGPYPLDVDTGAGLGLTVASAVADKLELQPGARVYHGDILVEREPALAALADEVRVGDVVWHRVPVEILERPDESARSSVGAIGPGLFARARVSLNFTETELLVQPSGPAEPGGVEVQFRLLDNRVMVPVTLQSEHARALLDTGTGFFSLRTSDVSRARDTEEPTSDTARLLELLEKGEADRDAQQKLAAALLDEWGWDSGPSIVGVSPSGLRRLCPEKSLTHATWRIHAFMKTDEMHVRQTEGLEVVFAGRACKDAVAFEWPALDNAITPRIGIQIDVLLGMDVLRSAQSVTIDFPNRRLWVQWPTAE
jgi:hypothetical protein